VIYLSLAVLVWAVVFAVTRAALRALRAETVRAPRAGEGGSSLSVIVAAHDEETRIGRLVESVLNQDHPDFELIVVDDRSSDRTLEAAREAAAGDSRARLMRLDERPAGWQGRLYAQSVGVLAARGEWLLFLSADQRLIDEDFLRSILAEYRRRGVRAASVIGPFPGRRWWQTWWYRPIADNPVLLGTILLLQRGRRESTWLIGALAMRRQTMRPWTLSR